MLLPAAAMFVFVLGALLPHTERNWFMGIRTPWTISNDIVWNKTHKLGSRLFEIAALFYPGRRLCAADYSPMVHPHTAS